MLNSFISVHFSATFCHPLPDFPTWVSLTRKNNNYVTKLKCGLTQNQFAAFNRMQGKKKPECHALLSFSCWSAFLAKWVPTNMLYTTSFSTLFLSLDQAFTHILNLHYYFLFFSFFLSETVLSFFLGK